MVLRDRSTMTEHSGKSARRFFGITCHDGLRLIGSLLLPMMLGVFTVVITVHQQNVAFQQRLEDCQLSREQREQDLNISREQRQQDLNIFALQREQDLNISREQRRQDKEIAENKQKQDKQIAENKQKQDKEIAENKQKQDNELAEKQRNLSDIQRAHELDITEQQLRDALLVAYMNDIAGLLKANNGTLTADPVVAIIARAKTLTALRQLDVSRKTYLIQFLYEAKQLTSGANPLDLSDAELNEVNFSSNRDYRRNLRNLSLSGTLLRNSSFSYRDLSNANFSRADLTDARFFESKLNDADISHTISVRTDFSNVELIGTRFDYTHSRRTLFKTARALNATFIEVNMESADFQGCSCKDIHFNGAQLERADFFRAQLDRSFFSGANLVRVNFSNANVAGSHFKGARLQSSNFTKSNCEGAIFTSAQLMGAQFVQAKLKDVDLTGLDMTNADFSSADLTLATLYHAKLDNTKFNGTDVSMTNFSFVTMKKALISDQQLFNAASIRGTTLSNGTKINRDPNMLHNGYADCNHTSLNNDWQVFPPDAIVISPKYDSPEDCVFNNQINSSSYMFQRADLSRYMHLTSRNRTIFVVTARGGGKISSIRINDHKDRLLAIDNFTQGSNSMRIQSYTHQPVVTVEFSGYGWCDDIDLTVQSIRR